jgi:hypothetical protein
MIGYLGLSDLVQLINYLELLRKRNFRRALEIGTIPHKFGVELDFRRRLFGMMLYPLAALIFVR